MDKSLPVSLNAATSTATANTLATIGTAGQPLITTRQTSQNGQGKKKLSGN
jgi:hypothetical protein